MMEFVNGLVENYKDSPPIPIGSSKTWNVSQLPDFITSSIFIDCTEITDHARDTAFEEYADRNTPPNSDVILPLASSPHAKPQHISTKLTSSIIFYHKYLYLYQFIN